MFGRPSSKLRDYRVQLFLLWSASIVLSCFLTLQFTPCSSVSSSSKDTKAAKSLTEDTTASKAHISRARLNVVHSSASHHHAVEDTASGSPAQTRLPNQSWLPALEYDKDLPPFAPIFMAFQFNYELLKQTLMSYKLAKVHNIIVLDNSLGRHAIGDVDTLKSTYGVAQVIEMPFSMYFTELQNLMAFMARQTHLPLYYWSHMDVMALPHSDRAEDAMGMRMSQCAEQAAINNASWGVIFNTNDYLSANKLEAFDSCGGYDTYVTTYTADCDFYARMRGNGYTTVDCNVGYIFDATLNNASVTEAMNAPSDQVSWQRKKELMEDMSWRKSKSRGAWREADFTDADRAAWWPLSAMGQNYYSKKFRGKECDDPAEGFIQFDRVAVPLAQVQANNQDLLDKYTQLYTGEGKTIM